MARLLARLVAVFALAFGALVAVAPTASAAQDVQVTLFFDFDGDGVYDDNESTRPPSSFHPVSSGWGARVGLYKVDENDQILQHNWVPLNYGTNPYSQRLSPGNWVAVLESVIEGDMNQAPAFWPTKNLTQTYPANHQSIAFEITPESGRQNLTFGYGWPQPEVMVEYSPWGPSFRAKVDENLNQVADPGEVDVPTGTQFTLRALHLAGDHTQTATFAAGTGGVDGRVTFDNDGRRGARILSVPYGSAAPPPLSLRNWSYAESPPGTVSYLIHEDVNDDCDPDPGDDHEVTCVYFRDPQERPAAAILPARTPITGTVFVDTDQDGIRDPGENAPTASVSLRFLRPDEYPETLTPNVFDWSPGTVAVGADGAFDLGSVPQGSYLLTTTSSQWRITTTAPIVVPSTGATLGPVEIGISRTFVSGRVWVDTDADRELDAGEQVLSGVTIESLNGNSESGQVLATAVTDSQGRYRVRVDPSWPRVRVGAGLPTTVVDSGPHPEIYLEATGDTTHDLTMHPKGTPGFMDGVVVGVDSAEDKWWWTPPTDPGDREIRGYVIRTWEFDSNNQFVRVLDQRCLTAAGSFSPGFTTEMTIQAVNSRGVGQPSWPMDFAEPGRPDGPSPVEVDCTTLAADLLPPAPTALTTKVRDRNVLVGWKAGTVTSAHSSPTHFQVQVRTGTGAWTNAALVGAAARSATVSTPVPRRSYSFRVIARNTQGDSVPSAAHSAVADAKPAKPISVKGTAKKKAATIGWKPGKVTGTTGKPTKFLIQQLVGGTWLTKKTVGVSIRSTTITGLTAGKAVKFRVVAYNPVGTTPSVAVKVTPRR